MAEQISQLQRLNGEFVAPHVELERAIEVLDLESGLVWEQTQAAYDTSDDAVKLKIDQLEDRHLTATREAEERGDPLPKLSTTLYDQEGIPEAFKTGVRALEVYAEKSLALENELEQHAPEKATEVLRRVAALEASLDYDRIVSLVPDDDWDNLLNKVSLVIGARQLLEAGRVPSYRQSQVLESSLNEYASEWQGEGIISGEEVSTPPH